MAGPNSKAPVDPKASQDASGRLRSSGDDIEAECGVLEDELEELKAKYEMYFLGVELREPVKWREEMRKRVLRIKEAFTRNTGLRFRLHSLHARYLSYERLWLRSAREREEGTYRRDLFKARLHQRGRQGQDAAARSRARVAKGESHESEDVDLSDFHDEGAPASPTAAAAPATPAAPPPRAAPAVPAPPVPVPPARSAVPGPPVARPPAPRPGGAASLGDAKMRELYDAYVTAKRRCNEDTSNLTFDAVARSVSKQIPEIMKSHQAKAVEFKVVIKDGKARLVAVPRT